jgi:hypothetical protein
MLAYVMSCSLVYAMVMSVSKLLSDGECDDGMVVSEAPLRLWMYHGGSSNDQ